MTKWIDATYWKLFTSVSICVCWHLLEWGKRYVKRLRRWTCKVLHSFIKSSFLVLDFVTCTWLFCVFLLFSICRSNMAVNFLYFVLFIPTLAAMQTRENISAPCSQTKDRVACRRNRKRRRRRWRALFKWVQLISIDVYVCQIFKFIYTFTCHIFIANTLLCQRRLFYTLFAYISFCLLVTCWLVNNMKRLSLMLHSVMCTLLTFSWR